MKPWSYLAFSVMLIVSSPIAQAQAQTQASKHGQLAGVVEDANGSPIAGAKIIVKGMHGSGVETSNSRGGFLFTELTPGFYSVEFEKDKFKTDEVKSIEVVADRTSSVRLKMQSGSGSLKGRKEDPCFVDSEVSVDTMQSSVTKIIDECTFRSLPLPRDVTKPFLEIKSGRIPQLSRTNISTVLRGKTVE